MPEYRRATLTGGTFFFTVVTYNRQSILTDEVVHDSDDAPLSWEYPLYAGSWWHGVQDPPAVRSSLASNEACG